MIVFDLQCGGGHVFEAWFGSTEAFEDQRGRGLVACPICGDGAVEKAVTAARLSGTGEGPDPKAVMQALATAQAKMLAKSQWVGSDFAAKARAMHVGDDAAGADPRPGDGRGGEGAGRGRRAGRAVAVPVVPPDARN